MATNLADVATAASASLGVAVTTVTPATATVVTRSPTLAPFIANPSPGTGATISIPFSPSEDDDWFRIRYVADKFEQASLISIGIVAVVVLFLCSGCVFCSARRARAKQRGSMEENIVLDEIDGIPGTINSEMKLPVGMPNNASTPPDRGLTSSQLKAGHSLPLAGKEKRNAALKKKTPRVPGTHNEEVSNPKLEKKKKKVVLKRRVSAADQGSLATAYQRKFSNAEEI
jgi:hypothetical protein